MASSIDKKFISHMEKLSADSNEAYLLHKNGRGGSWSLPPLSTAWNGDIFDFTSLGAAFDRSGIEEQYEKAIEKSVVVAEPDEPDDVRGTLNDIAAQKAQAGYLSQRERAFRVRHTTPIMAACYAAARRRGHGQNDTESTGVFGVVVNSINNMLNYGR